MPDSNTFYKWMNEDEQKLEQYARAREEQADYYLDEMIRVAYENNADVYVEPETGNVKIDGNVVQRSRLIVDSLKWSMARIAPKKYGDLNTTDLNVNMEQPLFSKSNPKGE